MKLRESKESIMGMGKVDGFGYYSLYPDERSEINSLIEDLRFSVEPILTQPWTSQDLYKLKEIAIKVIDQIERLQQESSTFSVQHEILNRIKDKVHDFVIHPVSGLLNPGTTESSPKELWGAIESAFYGPWSLYQEIKMLNSHLY